MTAPQTHPEPEIETEVTNPSHASGLGGGCGSVSFRQDESETCTSHTRTFVVFTGAGGYVAWDVPRRVTLPMAEMKP